MDDMFDLSDLCATEDSMLSEFDAPPEEAPVMRSRAYTWPTRPVTASVVVDETSNAGSESSPGGAAVMTVAGGARLLAADDSERGSRGELQLSPGGGVSASRKASSRRNAWGNLSYADLITKAIESSPEKRLTLSQIYAWMVSNVPFFSDKGDSNSSAGWKNSIRHNLSLHSRFIRVQNEGTGKSSWWMVNPDAITKLPRKRAGTMDSATVRRPVRVTKRPSGQLKHARSSELHASGELFDTASGARGSPSMVGNELPPGFDSPRVRASSGNSSTGGCSPAALGTPLECDIKPCFTMPPSTWDVLCPPKQETLSESLADIFISDAAGSRSIGGNCSPSASPQMYGGSHHGLQPQQQQQPPMFMFNEAYAHGVPVHQPSPQRFVPQAFSPPVAACNMVRGYPVTAVTSPGVGGYQANGSGPMGFNCGGPSSADHVPTLGELLQDQRSGYMLNTFLTSGGSVTTQQQAGWSGGDSLAGVTAGAPQPTATAAGTPPQRRGTHINQRMLMQLLATKPHLARRLQQLLEAKRRQLSAMQQQQQQSPVFPPTMPQLSPSTIPTAQVPGGPSTTVLQQLLTASGPRPQPLGVNSWTLPNIDPSDTAFPKDLDLNLLDPQSTSDINCDIEQVISHELSFGDKLDFSFDQLHLDEFDTDFGT